MIRVIYVAPLVKERYRGGIMRIAECLSEVDAIAQFNYNNIKIEFFNSSVLNQSKNSEGKFSWENIKQALFLFFNLAKRVRRKDFDAIHFNASAKFPLLKDQIIMFCIGLLTSKKIFFQIHYSGIEQTFLKSGFLKWLQLMLLKRFDKIILLSENFKCQLLIEGFPCRKMYVLYNFHSVRNFQENSIQACRNRLQLLFIGSINRRKGFHDLLKVLVSLDVEYELNVLGDFASDEMKQYVESFIADHNLRVRFHGYLSGSYKNDIIIASDILVLPSYAEGFPMVIPEAMALGCAVISTNIAGIPEIVQDGINGYLIKPGQIDDLKKKLLHLYNNRDILKVFKENNLKLAPNFSIESYINKLSLIYTN